MPARRDDPPPKLVRWMGSTREDLKDSPDEVKDAIGYAIWLAQRGGKHPDAKPLKGFGGARVIEITADFDGNTWRAVYTVQIADAIWVLHFFQKKSKKGIATPKSEIDLIEKRLKDAVAQDRRERAKRGH